MPHITSGRHRDKRLQPDAVPGRPPNTWHSAFAPSGPAFGPLAATLSAARCCPLLPIFTVRIAFFLDIKVGHPTGPGQLDGPDESQICDHQV